jgi:hypothetical protein
MEGSEPPALGCRPATREEACCAAAPVESLHVMEEASREPVEVRVTRAEEGLAR